MSAHTSTILPGSATHTYNARRAGYDFGFNFPFWRGSGIAQDSQHAWTVAQFGVDGTEEYACDTGLVGDEHDTLHQMWVRLRPPARASCLEHLRAGETLTAVYPISTSRGAQDVYCDMTTNGGGWTLVASISGTNRKHTSADATTPLREHAAPGNYTGYKLADVDVNAIVTDRYRFKCATCTLFFEPIAFDASGDSACRATHRWGTNASAYEGVGSCESRGYPDSGVSSRPNDASTCGGYAQYNSDGQRGCFFSAVGHGQNGELWVR
jgi:hypothetical protein